MVGANKYGKMEPFTKDIGKMIWPTDKEGLFSLEEMFMKANGSTIKHKEKVSTFTKTVLLILESGTTTNNMDMGTKNGQMVLSTRETTYRA